MRLFKQWQATLSKSDYHTFFDTKVFYDTEKCIWQYCFISVLRWIVTQQKENLVLNCKSGDETVRCVQAQHAQIHVVCINHVAWIHWNHKSPPVLHRHSLCFETIFWSFLYKLWAKVFSDLVKYLQFKDCGILNCLDGRDSKCWWFLCSRFFSTYVWLCLQTDLYI